VSAPFVVEMVVAAGLLFGVPDAGTSPVDGGQATAAVEEDDEDDGKPAVAWEPTAAQKAAMFFGIPDTETDDINDPGHWAQILGFCDALHASGRDCGYDDGTPECQAAQARNRPCTFNMGRSRSLHWMRSIEPEQSWRDRWGDQPDCPVGVHPSSLPYKCVPRGFIGERTMWYPEWVPSDQPTLYQDSHGYWMKLRLEASVSELSPPARVRARPAPAATAWEPERLPAFAGQSLGALRTSPPLGFVGQVEAHVRTLAAVPAHIIQRVREGR
jgi:hypothetical protein